MKNQRGVRIITPKVCIIEDEAAIRDMYRLRFSLEAYEVQVAANGVEGLTLIETFHPDVTLLDLRMPLMGGEEMLTQLRNTSWGSTCKVIILTNISRDEAPAMLQFLRVSRYIVKAHTTPAEVVKIAQEVMGL